MVFKGDFKLSEIRAYFIRTYGAATRHVLVSLKLKSALNIIMKLGINFHLLT